jgi:hypothetical protein
VFVLVYKTNLFIHVPLGRKGVSAAWRFPRHKIVPLNLGEIYIPTLNQFRPQKVNKIKA